MISFNNALKLMRQSINVSKKPKQLIFMIHTKE